jgi:hypothetical protein
MNWLKMMLLIKLMREKTLKFEADKVSEEINCSMCAEIIPNYEPNFFHGIEINPACQDCSPRDPVIHRPVSSCQERDSISSSSSPAVIEASFPKCSDFSRIESVQGFPPTKPFLPVKPFPPLDRFSNFLVNFKLANGKTFSTLSVS